MHISQPTLLLLMDVERIVRLDRTRLAEEVMPLLGTVVHDLSAGSPDVERCLRFLSLVCTKITTF